MLKRLLVGLLLGAVLGGIAAAVLVQGLGVSSFADKGALAFLSAAVLGLVTGLVAGKPIWSTDGKIEAGLKAFFGMVIALGGMFVLRRFLTTPVDLTALKAGSGPIGLLPAASLPLISAVLAAFYELDNTGSSDKEKEEKAPASGKKVRVGTKEDGAAEEEEDEAEDLSAGAKKKRK